MGKIRATRAHLAGQQEVASGKHVEPEMHHFLARLEKDSAQNPAVQLNMLERIDETTWKGVSSALELILQAYRGFNIHLRIAYDDLVEELSLAHEGLLESNALDDTTLMRLINRALHMAVALRLYEEHVMSDIHRRWGATSDQTAAAKRLFSGAFDQSFGYRVLYALRNALVHTAEQLVTCHFAKWLDDPESDVPVTEVRVTLGLSRSAFARTDVRAATRKEVSALDEDPDILALAEEALAQVEILNSTLEPYLYPDMDQAVVLIWETARTHFPSTSQAPSFVAMDGEAHPTTLLPVRPVFWDYIVRRASAVETNRKTPPAAL